MDIYDDDDDDEGLLRLCVSRAHGGDGGIYITGGNNLAR